MPLKTEIESGLNSHAWKEECDACDEEYKQERRESELAMAEDEAYEKGYQRGKREGHERGFADGRDYGYREGLRAGLRDGLLEGMKDGIKQGILMGRNAFKTEIAQRLKNDGIPEDQISAWIREDPLSTS